MVSHTFISDYFWAVNTKITIFLSVALCSIFDR